MRLSLILLITYQTIPGMNTYIIFDENLPELINAGNHFISIYINTDDCSMEFSTEQPDSSDNLFYYPFTIAGIYFTVYFD